MLSSVFDEEIIFHKLRLRRSCEKGVRIYGTRTTQHLITGLQRTVQTLDEALPFSDSQTIFFLNKDLIFALSCYLAIHNKKNWCVNFNPRVIYTIVQLTMKSLVTKD